MRITAAMLREKGACEEQVKVFEAEWPDGASVTLSHCRRGVELGMDVEWAGTHLLSGTVLAAYQQATATALAAYQQAMATAGAAYQQATATALAAYRQARAPALVAYVEAQCLAFYTAAKEGGDAEAGR